MNASYRALYQHFVDDRASNSHEIIAHLPTENCTKDNFPLVFSDVELVIREAPENLDFLQRFLPKLDWSALVDTAASVSAWTGVGGVVESISTRGNGRIGGVSVQERVWVMGGTI
jgi:hypothetical protein